MYDNGYSTFYFSPASMTIAPGTTVTVTNDGSVVHTWTSDTMLWNSGNVNPGSSYSFTFNTPGTYHYHCMYHQSYGMVGTITVT